MRQRWARPNIYSTVMLNGAICFMYYWCKTLVGSCGHEFLNFEHLDHHKSSTRARQREWSMALHEPQLQ